MARRGQMGVIKRRQEVIAIFVEEGFQGVEGYRKALLANGYGKQIALTKSGEDFNTPKVQNLIAEERAKHEYTKEKAVKLLNELKEDCITNADRTNRLGCIKELDRIHGLYGDEDANVTINQLIVSPEERKKVLEKELKLLNDIKDAPLCIAE